jgi:capsule biosynthesis phosphatase
MRICIDLDGVICRLKNPGEQYEDLLPVDGAPESLQALKEHGHYIIINTARHMKTCQGNLGQVAAKISLVTLNWLQKYNVPYDEIYFGKPHADVYIDDNAFRFNDWEAIAKDGSSLPMSKEKQKLKEPAV